MIDPQVFNKRLDTLFLRIKQACQKCGRDPSEVMLMAVTKNHPPAAVEMAASGGLICVGENRVQEAADKRPQTEAAIRWELIGHLQTNKAKAAVALFDRIQSVDRIKLVRVLQKLVREGVKPAPYPILLQVNAGRDPAKFGCEIEEVDELLRSVMETPELKVEGLMTIAPLDQPAEAARPTFACLREIRDRLEQEHGIKLPELSMGMTGDLEAAIAEGSTLIRIGTALYGERDI
jgi:PLP dependent protein